MAQKQLGISTTNKTLTSPVVDRSFITVSGAAPLVSARAWVNFNGTNGLTALRASGNVSSISRTGTGVYIINFSTAMSDTNYSVVGEGFTGVSGNVNMGLQVLTYSMTSVAIQTWNSQGPSDYLYINLAIFR